MSDENTRGGALPPLPEPKLSRKRDWLPSLIWLIPIVAAVVGLTLVVKILVERGPSITITFRTAEGLEAGKTKVKYKDVDIGLVQTITLSKDRSHVLANVQLSKEAESFTAADTRFWVVRPRVAASGVSGLSTLLSGAYIGADAGTSKETKDEFTGLEVQPIVRLDASGKQYMLHATDIGSLDIGSPVYYRRIKVGQLAAFDLDADGKGVTLRIFIDAPYDKFIGVNTRFWHASGFDMQINASGFKLRTQSLATVVLGGIAFQAPDDQLGTTAKENTTFNLAADEEAALKEPDGPSETVVMYFNQSLRGLTPGTTVDFRGVVLGEVKSIGIEYDTKRREFSMPVVVQVYPERLGRRYAEDEKHSSYTAKQRLQYMVSRGLRAQLRTGNLLTGQLYVALDFFPKAAPATIDTSSAIIELPTIPNSLDEIQSQIAEIAKKLSKVPFDQIAADLQKTLGTLNRTLLNAEQLTKSLNNDVAPEITAAMKDVRVTLDNANRTLSDNAPLQQDIRATLQELTRSAASVRILTDYLERHPEALIRGKQEEKK
ncbi:intermembrane transport protein PqiB [Collimonas sp. OK412]|jgi:paraquat-inducible protein B|uniref:PqiB family protein n=1 Tax=Collimonas sp. (strain OK412) TaxID=1801619 RepID=UPI0008E278A8|nr:MlaD family protein [Collimonas sp. OK412]SFC89082.1 paraquat-inducible protein B [Collimonas sp. OK412]